MKLKLGCSLGICRREEIIEVDDDDLVGLTEEERQKYIHETIDAWLPNHVDCWGEFIYD